MPEYLYVVQTDHGAIERGRITGSAPADAREKLSHRGLRLVSLQESSIHRWTVRDLVAPFRRRTRSLRPTDTELTLQQLSVLLGSGLELAPSLRELGIHSAKRRTQQMCVALAEAIEQGKSFEAALAETQAFPAVVTRLARVGEETGELPVMLQRAAEFVETRRLARGSLLAALAYPLLVAIAACSVAVYLVGWAIPKLALFLHALGRELPAMTQSLLDISSIIREYGPLFSLLVATGVLAVGLVYSWKPGRYRIDKALLRVPLIGPLMQIAETQQLASSLALMLRSGVFLPDALHTTATLHRNAYLAAQVARSREKLAMGEDLAGSFRDGGFAPMLSSMIAVGERTGELPRTLDHVAKFYAAQLQTRLKRLGKLIEPTIIFVVGGGVGYVYIAFFMALLSAGGNFQ